MSESAVYEALVFATERERQMAAQASRAPQLTFSVAEIKRFARYPGVREWNGTITGSGPIGLTVVRRALSDLADDGDVVAVKRGYYRLPEA